MDNNCINCDEPVDMSTPHKVLTVSAIRQGGTDSGTIEELERWPVCATCERTQPVKLVEYVRAALS